MEFNYIFENALEDACQDCKICDERGCGMVQCFKKFGQFCPVREAMQQIKRDADALFELIEKTRQDVACLEPEDAKDLEDEIKTARDDDDDIKRFERGFNPYLGY